MAATINQVLGTRLMDEETVVELNEMTEIRPCADDNHVPTELAVKSYVDGKDDSSVHKTGDETVAGVKVFSQSPRSVTPGDGDSEGDKLATLGWVRGRIDNWWSDKAGGTVAIPGRWSFANPVTCSVNGNADTATRIKTARTFVLRDSAGGHSGPAVSFDGTANATLSLPSTITATVDGHATDDLPLSGGAMTGSIVAPSVALAKASTDSAGVTLVGGTDYSSSSFTLRGKSSSANPGGFEMSASNGNGTHVSMVGSAGGSLTWGGKNVVRSVSGVIADAGGNVRLSATDVAALPLTGGTMSGRVVFSGSMTSDSVIGRSDDAGSVVIAGGASASSGASVSLTGGGSSTGPGSFMVRAAANGSSKVLRGEPSGKLTWDGAEIVRSVNGKSASFGNGNVTVSASDVGAVPSAGGNVNGGLTFTDNDGPYVTIRRATDTNSTVICGGTGVAGGARMILSGKGSSYGGAFHIESTNAQNVTKSLVGTSSGTLQWDGVHIVRSVNGVTAGTGGNVSITASTVGALSTSGGTLSGQITRNGSLAVSGSDSGYVMLAGGTSASYDSYSGARMVLFGEKVKEGGLYRYGGFWLEARGHTNPTAPSDLNKANVSLRGDCTGVLTWGGVNIVRSVNGKSAVASGAVTVSASDVGAVPSAGGSLSGSIVLNGTYSFGRRVDDTGYVSVCGGVTDAYKENSGTGARLVLFGKDCTQSNGGFTLSTNGNVDFRLSGKSGGSLTWGQPGQQSQNIVRSVNGINADAGGNVTVPTGSSPCSVFEVWKDTADIPNRQWIDLPTGVFCLISVRGGYNSTSCIKMRAKSVGGDGYHMAGEHEGSSSVHHTDGIYEVTVPPCTGMQVRLYGIELRRIIIMR